MRIKESMDTTDIKDTTETMAIPVLECPETVLGRPVLEYPGTVLGCRRVRQRVGRGYSRCADAFDRQGSED